MINYWWVTRPKRVLSPIPSVLSTIVTSAYDSEWEGNRNMHLGFENQLEKLGLKRVGDRRDQTGGGARTYAAWLKSLGLIFKQNSTGKLRLTLAGEAILRGENPFLIISNQVLKYQFPSSYSISPYVNVSERFKVHPFIFLLRLLRDDRLRYLTQEEIGKVVIVSAENDSKGCFESVVQKILDFREKGDDSLVPNFAELYAPSKGGRDGDDFGHLLDVANTFINWLDYTRLIDRDTAKIMADPEKLDIIDDILCSPHIFIPRPNDEEFFQRSYGVDPKHKKDTRNLDDTLTITQKIIEENYVKKAFIAESMLTPIVSVNGEIVCKISDETGIERNKVEDILCQSFPNKKGLISGFLANYRDMAFCSKEKAIDFERATTDIFSQIFGLKSKHIGPIGKTPDVIVMTDNKGWSGIFDNKAYREYSITNDHHNRMVRNYIGDYRNYCGDFDAPLNFFSYIAGGFVRHIDSQIQEITNETGVCGSAIKVDCLIHIIEQHQEKPYSHDELKKIFSVGRQINYSDFSNTSN